MILQNKIETVYYRCNRIESSFVEVFKTLSQSTTFFLVLQLQFTLL